MSSHHLDSGTWIPLMDYAMQNGVSLSTLRRYIKAGKIQFKSEQGKYLILSSQPASHDWLSPNEFESDLIEGRVSNLEVELKKAQEEISELKMLVAIYEERLFQNLPAQI